MATRSNTIPKMTLICLRCDSSTSVFDTLRHSAVCRALRVTAFAKSLDWKSAMNTVHAWVDCMQELASQLSSFICPTSMSLPSSSLISCQCQVHFHPIQGTWAVFKNIILSIQKVTTIMRSSCIVRRSTNETLRCNAALVSSPIFKIKYNQILCFNQMKESWKTKHEALHLVLSLE
jgi:hypothetical protein